MGVDEREVGTSTNRSPYHRVGHGHLDEVGRIAVAEIGLTVPDDLARRARHLDSGSGTRVVDEEELVDLSSAEHLQDCLVAVDGPLLAIQLFGEAVDERRFPLGAVDSQGLGHRVVLGRLRSAGCTAAGLQPYESLRHCA